MTQLPDFKMAADEVPDVKIKSIRFQNFKAFNDATFDFMDGDKVKKFICFHGPNGCGKTTILEAITLIFSRLDGREDSHLKALLGKSVRHVGGEQNAIYNDEDFLITAQMSSSTGDYEVQINKTGFVKDHPVEIKEMVYRLCYYARFDQELHQFQLNREQWPLFKELFEAVTGFEAEEREGVFNESADPVQAEMLRKYVLSFWIHKPDEIISHKECSAGERKIIKSFSTLLNKEYMPSVVCVDNAEMHVEAGRHIHLIESMKKCFPNSQIFASTHSYQISRNFGDRSQLYDLRLLKTSGLVKKEPWRLYIADEIKDALSKLKSIPTPAEGLNNVTLKRDQLIIMGNILQKQILNRNWDCIIPESKAFLKKVSDLYVRDLVSYKSPIKIKGYKKS